MSDVAAVAPSGHRVLGHCPSMDCWGATQGVQPRLSGPGQAGVYRLLVRGPQGGVSRAQCTVQCEGPHIGHRRVTRVVVWAENDRPGCLSAEGGFLTQHPSLASGGVHTELYAHSLQPLHTLEVSQNSSAGQTACCSWNRRISTVERVKSLG